MKKNPRRSRHATRPDAAPPLTDPHLAALLLHISCSDGIHDNDGRHAARLAQSAASAHRLLTSQPITSAFGMYIDRPGVEEQVSANLLADIPNWTDPKDSRRAFKAIDAALESAGPKTILANDVEEILPAYVYHSVQLGACLMYELLKGGAR